MPAHAGHWHAEAPYVARVVLLAGWPALSGRREKRRATAGLDRSG